MTLLLALTLRGSVVFALVWLLDRALRGRMQARSRRAWWLLVPVSFLLPVGFKIFPESANVSALESVHDGMQADSAGIVGGEGTNFVTQGGQAFSFAWLIFGLWLAGAIAYLAVVIIRTVRASRRWSRLRLSTDSALTSLLEDCKAAAGITAPIGIVVSTEVPAPALLGW